jgi:4-amino-4-deoxy-L-arabinose transferase-like glycosyltransferase
MPKHELAEFFENFHLVTDRVYASKYGPGTALWYAPAALLHLPPWITPLLLSGAAVGLMYLLAAELFGGASGLLAALVLVSLGAFRRTSIMMMSQAPVLALLLMAMLAFVYWRQKRCGGCMLLLGICVGWAAITRPVDALCLAVPLAAAVLVELWRADNRTRVRTIALGLAGVAPFILLQAIYNKGVTGSVTTLPWNYYALRYDPYDTMGRKPLDTRLMPEKLLPQKQAIIDDFTKPAFEAKSRQSAKARLIDRTTKLLAGPPLEEQEPGRLVYGALPTPLLVALVPVGLMAMMGRRRWMLLLPLGLFLAIYANYSYFFPHYTVAVLPAVILLVLGAPAAVGRTWPQLAAPAGWVVALVVAAVSVTALPQVNPVRHDQWFDAPLLRGVDAAVAGIGKRPAIVLFKYDPERSIHEEPVYNAGVAWPDDAEVIRAHDLGERNRELFDYYASRSPGREVYRFDEKDQKLTDLGNVAELSRSPAGR